MPAPEIIEAAVQQYFTAFSNRDLEALSDYLPKTRLWKTPSGAK